MMLLVKLLMPIIGGLATHAITRPLIERHFTPPYQNLAQYGVGYLLIQPFAILFDDHLGDVDNEMERHVLSNLLAGILFGLGVMAGYFSDAVCKNGSERG
jgi:hypothetical protein